MAHPTSDQVDWMRRLAEDLFAEYRRLVYLSDIIWPKGKVSQKYVGDPGGILCLLRRAENQRVENVVPGDSTIILPSREKKD
jgi:hypothetical protein